MAFIDHNRPRNPRMSTKRIVVLGAGPAGVAVAIGLRRAGEEVLLVGEPRRFAAVEGVSARVLGALHKAGFARAVRCFAPPSQRCVTWDGTHSRANWESLVDRQAFDRAALEDARSVGVSVVTGRIVSCASAVNGHHVEVDHDGRRTTFAADFIVEARGRAAPGQGSARVRGAETVSLLQYWVGPPATAGSAVESCADGWVWMAALADGRRYLQLTLDVATAALPPKRELGAFCRARFDTLETARPFLEGAEPVGEPHARTSTPVLQEEVAGHDWLRVGDAAMAVDPLSGNGIFQALSSALQAPAVIGTLLHDPDRAALARRFHQERIENLFFHFARIGRDFHAQESRWPDEPFWRTRRAWPDAQPIHPGTAPDDLQVTRRPVVSDGRIVEDDVVVTPDQPLGIWHVDGVRLAPLVRALHACGSQTSAEAVLRAELGGDATRAARVAAWMREQGWLAGEPREIP
ncbi:Dehydrogenase (flavoprotein) [Aromatoleum tolulyticum]|uniref:Dehydrogenase (Flavoprotein) n=2 Tax=Aromatoleum tolulyticum TaxID=34027 RepID=A0A1N7CP66_9RHOO|nr:Dehydrogenase (flavoprotein) [Aromatoleum tolulyticum]